MRDLLAKLVRGGINRREFAQRMMKAGFGAMTIESILDVVAVGQDKGKPPAKQPAPHYHDASGHHAHADEETKRAFIPFSPLTPYQQWSAQEGVPVHSGYDIPNVRAVELGQWKRMGVQGAILDLTGAEGTDGMFLYAINPGQTTNAHRFMFEETIFVLDGEGETTVWYERGHSQTFKWQKNSLFSPPLNTWRQHRAGGTGTARLISFHDAPVMLDILHSPEFVFNNDFVFRDRYNNQPDYFVMNDSKLDGHGSAATFGEGDQSKAKFVDTGLVPDINDLHLYESKARGVRNKSIEMVLSDNTMQTHISQFDVGTYKRAHRHGPGSQILALDGVGYTLFWKDTPKFSDAREHRRAEWSEGAIFVPPDRWYHQHFNVGDKPARYMATTWIGGKYFAMSMGGGGRTHRLNTVSYREGGNMIDYTDEDPQVRSIFEEELKKHGVPSRMPGRSGA